MPNIIHVAVSAVAVALFVILAALFIMGEIELNPVSHNLMAMAHTK
jgi:hypothetical protein